MISARAAAPGQTRLLQELLFLNAEASEPPAFFSVVSADLAWSARFCTCGTRVATAVAIVDAEAFAGRSEIAVFAAPTFVVTSSDS